MEVMFQARGSDRLIIIDANKSGSKPGSIFEVPGEELSNVPEPAMGLHGFRWDHALYAGKKIFKSEFPEDVTVFLIEAECLDLGLDLSDSVKNAADRVVEIIVTRIRGRGKGSLVENKQELTRP
jgi:hydrogenase maturation protease